MNYYNKFVLSYFLQVSNTVSEGACPYGNVDWVSPQGQQFALKLADLFEERKNMVVTYDTRKDKSEQKMREKFGHMECLIKYYFKIYKDFSNQKEL